MSDNVGRLLPKEQSEIAVLALRDEECVGSIALLSQLFSSCLGPGATLKAIHNNSGGHVTVTSSSSRILQSVSRSKPVLRLICTAVQNHIDQFMDQGIFAAVLTLSLVETYLKSSLHCHLICDVLEIIATECSAYFNSDVCSCKFKLNLNNIDHLLKLTRSVVSTKPQCKFSEKQTTHISEMIVESFLNSFKNSEEGVLNMEKCLRYTLLEGYPVNESRLIDGLLLEMPNIPVYKQKPVHCKRLLTGPHKGHIKVAVLDVSMAGDSEAFQNVTYELEDVSLSDVVLEDLMNLARCFVDNSIGLLACQKVVHPQVKQYLHDHEVLVIERLGSAYMPSFVALSGAVCLSSLNVPPSENYVGYLQNVRHCVYGERSFLQFEGVEGNAVSTLVLCNTTEEALEETKTVVKSATSVLETCVRDGYCLYGGGCWQNTLAQHIHKMTAVNSENWARSVGCTPRTVREVADIFIQCLLKTIRCLDTEAEHMIDTVTGHHWTFPHSSDNTDISKSCLTVNLTDVSCVCGAVQFNENLEFLQMGKESLMTENCSESHPSDFCQYVNEKNAEVVDSFGASVSAVQTAISTAIMVLGIHNIVKQK